MPNTMLTRSKTRKRQSEEDANSYGLSLAVAKIVKINHFDSGSATALGLLSKTSEKLIIDLATRAKVLAEVSQRSSVNERDLFLTLTQLNIDIPALITFINQRLENFGKEQIQNANANASSTATANTNPNDSKNDAMAMATTSPEPSKKFHFDSIDPPQPSTKVKDFEILPVGPKKKPQLAFSTTNPSLPDLPDLHSFKRTACFVHQNEKYDKIRSERAENKLASVRNLASFIARSEYYREPKGNSAVALFGEAEVVAVKLSSSSSPTPPSPNQRDTIQNQNLQNSIIKISDRLTDEDNHRSSGTENEKSNFPDNTQINSIESTSQESNSKNWSILPILLNNPSKNSMVSVYAQALTPTKSETDLLLDKDGFLAKKKPLRPKKEVKKQDGRSNRHHRKNLDR